jgi:phage terminase Nu1 subunit (DNA packaging protein)
MLPETITTNELVKLSGYAKSSLTALQQQGVIERIGPDTWPTEAITKLIAHLRERKPVVSTEREKFERARAAREQMKAEQMAGSLCKTSDFHEAWDALIGYTVAGLVAIPARCTRDLGLRQVIQKELDAWRSNVANEFKRRAEELGKGSAA